MARDVIPIRLDSDERAALDAFAKQNGLSIAGAVRRLVRDMMHHAAVEGSPALVAVVRNRAKRQPSIAATNRATRARKAGGK